MNDQPYDSSKFENFNRVLDEQKRLNADVLLIHHPEVLGDNYAELVTNLNKLAEAGLSLKILPPSERGVRSTPQQDNLN